MQRQHNRRYQPQLQHDARNGVQESAHEKCLKGEGAALYSHKHYHSCGPDCPSCKHGNYKAAVERADAAIFAGIICKAGKEAVCPALKAHRDSRRIGRRHPEKQRARQGEEQADNKALPPAADQPA